ncbi:hypothetical protein [Spirosoma oryzicola]|uniref:hypothetical protein n=1 Tax=Spirosoma oryzicola TaxID=2898794 RepID=UPI001E5B4F1E|nr:hypothetical protein [Spirosoma oryzicola]UHG93278.1 hypothetical protein LQ777_10335 [Spirosoma oryzicola]
MKELLMLDYTRDILPYLELGSDNKPNPKYRHSFYQASIDHKNRLKAAFRKKMPDYLNINRPKEREEYKKYREAIYRNTMRSFRTRIVEALDYIRQADDFEVVYPKQQEQTASVRDSLEGLLSDSKFTKDGDLTNWFFSKVRKKYVDDPNAVIVMLPMTQPISDSERVRPEPLLIGSEFVYQHRKGEFAVLQSPEKTWITNAEGRPEKTGVILLFVDVDTYCVARQKSRFAVAGKTQIEWDVTGLKPLVSEEDPATITGYSFSPPKHYCPVLPVRKIGKLSEDEAEEKSGQSYTLVSSNDAGEEFFESIIADALPHIEGAQEVGSDIQIERNFHVSSQEWRFGQKQCADSIHNGNGGRCNGGKIPILDNEGMPIVGKTAMCPTCKGSGMDVSGSGMGLIIVSAPGATNLQDEGRPTNLPIPPGGFIPRPIEGLQEFVKEYEREKKSGYETVNMQFLMERLNDQSGTAKRLDLEELYKTLIVNGAHLCGLLEFLFECAAYQRKQESEKPSIEPPVRLSIENSELTRQELVEAVEKGFDVNLRKPLEKKLIKYQSGEDSDYYRRYELRERIDPYQVYNVETKLFIKSEARLTMQIDGPEYRELCECINLSIHFDKLVTDELLKGEGFWNLKPAEQYAKLREGARKMTAPAKPVQIDPKTGLPTQQEGQLAPIVDLKNNNQLKL